MLRNVTRLLLLTFILAVKNPASSQEKHDPDSAEEILLRSNNYVTLLDEYWPRISQGDTDAMVIAYNALNNCWVFRDYISGTADINEFDARMQGHSEGMRDYGRGIYYKCKNLVDRFDQYPGWQQLRLRAAIAGDRHSQLWLIREFYRFREEYDIPREAFPYSPAEFMIDALEDRDIDGFIVIATGESPWGIRRDNSKVTSTAWMLVACEYSKDCDEARSMEVYCTFMSTECAKYETAQEMIRGMVAGEALYAAAEQEAQDLIEKINARDWEGLGLDLVW